MTKEDIRKFSKFETLATTICDQQDAIETLRRRYDEQVVSSSAQLAHLTRSHEAKMAQELGQAKVHVDVAKDGNYGAKTLDHNKRIHYGNLKDRYRQRRDRTRQLIAQLSTLNTRNNLNPTEVRLLGKTLSKENIRKCSKFDTLATTIYDQQDALEALRRRYDEQVASSSPQLAHLTRS